MCGRAQSTSALITDLSGPFGSAGDLAHDVQLELPSECASTHVLPSPSFLRSMYRTFPAELPLPHGPVRGVHSKGYQRYPYPCYIDTKNTVRPGKALGAQYDPRPAILKGLIAGQQPDCWPSGLPLLPSSGGPSNTPS